MNVHQTIKELKNEGTYFGIIFLGMLISGVVFYAILNYTLGLTLIVLSSAFAFMTILISIKVHARYTQELLCKLNNKKLLDYCQCDYCTEMRNTK